MKQFGIFMSILAAIFMVLCVFTFTLHQISIDNEKGASKKELNEVTSSSLIDSLVIDYYNE